MSAGFSIIPNWLLRESDLTARELLVYIALLNRADRFGVAYPSMKTLAKEARSDERTVRDALKSLEKRGIVKTQRRPQEGGRHLPNLYRVAIFDRESPRREGGVQERTPVGGDSAPEWGAQTQEEVDPLEVDPEEEDVRSALQAEQTRSYGFSFPDGVERASRKQREYIRDLWIHLHREVPSEEQEQHHSHLTSDEAAELIAALLREMPRYDAYEGPEPGEDAYEALSDVGKQWSDRGMLPEGAGAIR
ncbi:helix-turn-helix domain-containing protein [Agrococcus sp. DT81.2]|uniref:helix-turn-helix domain-containing protein n=1 Tax=Agrococcus sp. DT81.2 TaxID=3393414 RepID=UPI003CE5720F